MTHFAKIENGIVTAVIAAEQEFIDTQAGQWVQTSYNTRGGVHYDAAGQPGGGQALRGNFAGVGFIYDAANDVFYPPAPYPSWVLNTLTWTWEPSVPMPDDGTAYRWDESTGTWVSP